MIVGQRAAQGSAESRSRFLSPRRRRWRRCCGALQWGRRLARRRAQMRLCLLLTITIILRPRLLDGHPPLLRAATCARPLSRCARLLRRGPGRLLRRRPGRRLPGRGRRRHLAWPRRGSLVGRRAAPRQLGEQLVEPALLHRLEASARRHLRAKGVAMVRRARRAQRVQRAQRDLPLQVGAGLQF